MVNLSQRGDLKRKDKKNFTVSIPLLRCKPETERGENEDDEGREGYEPYGCLP